MTSEQSRRWAVMKFGGTSVSQAHHWNTIAHEAGERLAGGNHVLLVLSALSGVTDLLTRLSLVPDEPARSEVLGPLRARHDELLDALGMEAGDDFHRIWRALLHELEPDSRLTGPSRQAAIVANGERLATAIAVQALRQAGLEARLQDATGLLEASGGANDSPLAATCDAHADPEMEARLAGEGRLHVTQGFIARAPDGDTWLLGRGGSDTSAACLAARLGAASLEIWTDVPGMFTADPRIVPHARLLQRLSYSEAQELASMGAKVLHPPSVRICKQAGILLQIRDTTRPEVEGTRIGPRSAATDARLKGIVSRRPITLVMMESPTMWRQVGFLAEAFDVFRRHGLSVDLISTSESSVTVSLDPGRPAAGDETVLRALVRDLSALCDAEVRTDCASISLVGNGIRTILGRLSEALDVFQDRKVYMVTQSANDLNLTLVVDQEHADRLVQRIHQLLMRPTDGAPDLGISWRDLTGPRPEAVAPPWWRREAAALGELLNGRDCALVYHLDSVRAAAERLLNLEHIGRVLYAVKANDHPAVLRALRAAGTGFDCVSLPELHHALEAVPEAKPDDVLFTPNFAPRSEYEAAFELGVGVTVDNVHPLVRWPEMFAGRRVFLRVDLDLGHGHHRKVVTSGMRSKFGIDAEQLVKLSRLLRRNGVTVSGLHAHTGSGVFEPEVWAEQLSRLKDLLHLFPDVRVLDLGGGLGVPDLAGQPALDLERLDAALGEAARGLDAEVWLEPGRYLVADCGVLLARVTQLKTKGGQHYLGVATGMNSLIRPALYGAYHQIANLSRLDEPATHRYCVVGPICETGDILGESRFLPECREGDIIAIANAGAYGHVMASAYNRREPAVELVMEGGAEP